MIEQGNKPFSLALWSRMLSRLSQEGSFSDINDINWSEKLERTIHMHFTEIKQIAPWAELLASIRRHGQQNFRSGRLKIR